MSAPDYEFVHLAEKDAFAAGFVRGQEKATAAAEARIAALEKGLRRVFEEAGPQGRIRAETYQDIRALLAATTPAAPPLDVLDAVLADLDRYWPEGSHDRGAYGRGQAIAVIEKHRARLAASESSGSAE